MNKAFTLAEILIVVAILGILAAITESYRDMPCQTAPGPSTMGIFIIRWYVVITFQRYRRIHLTTWGL
ncbi:MAG: prepilin-type N-terminal cleavage/methylation domain-containing protein [Planctomycetota bacterium]